MFMSIFSNTGMAFGCQIITMFEGTGAGIQWSTIAQGASPDDNLSLLDVIIMLIVDGFLYLLLAIYVEAVFPGDYGVPLPWYFPLTVSVSYLYFRSIKPETEWFNIYFHCLIFIGLMTRNGIGVVHLVAQALVTL